MRKIISYFILSVLLFFPVAISIASSHDVIEELPERSIFEILNTLTSWLYTFLLGIVVVAIIIGGYYFAMAGGDPEKVKKGQHIVTWAIVGLIVALLALGIRNFVRNEIIPPTSTIDYRVITINPVNDLFLEYRLKIV